MTGELLGAVDVSGGHEVASPYALALVRAAVGAVEADLAARDPARRCGWCRARAPDEAWLQVLGVDAPLLHVGGRAHPITPRHAEILLVLAGHEAGVGGDTLAESPERAPAVPGDGAGRGLPAAGGACGACSASRPSAPGPTGCSSRWAATPTTSPRPWPGAPTGGRSTCTAGRCCPSSEAPVATRARHELQGRLRGSVLRAGSTDSLWRWASHPGPRRRRGLAAAAARAALRLAAPGRGLDAPGRARRRGLRPVAVGPLPSPAVPASCNGRATSPA